VSRRPEASWHAVRLGAAALAVASWVLAGVVAGQDPPSAPSPAVAPAAAGDAPRVTEVGPQIFYLQDDAGRLVPVPGFRYSDFVELFRMQEGLPGAVRPPAAVL